MARPLRIEYEGACGHAMNRGKGRQRVFHGGYEYGLFLGNSRGRARLSASRYGPSAPCPTTSTCTPPPLPGAAGAARSREAREP